MVSMRSAGMKDLIQYTYGENKTAPFCCTPRDLFMARALVRWNIMSTAQLVRYEAAHAASITEWEAPSWDAVSSHRGALLGALSLHGTQWQLVKVRRDRLSKMSRLVNMKQPTRIGPMVQGFTGFDRATLWAPMPFGAELCGLEGWVRNVKPDPYRLPHQQRVCDIGTQIEAHGWRVASPREMTRKMLVDGTELDDMFTSRASNEWEGTTRTITPDLAILSERRDQSIQTFIAVDIVDDAHRSTQIHTERITAYGNNSRVHAVMMVCETESIARRVHNAAIKAYNGNQDRAQQHVNVTVVDTSNGYWHMPFFHPEDNPEGHWNKPINASLEKLLPPQV